MRDLISGPRRFVELQRVLPGISTEQLRSRLNRMVADGMLTRKRYREVPPRVDYELTDRAKELAPVLGELARWGYEWAWGAPRPNEAIDVSAIFRLLPGLLAAGSAAVGRLELVVTDGWDGSPAVFSVMLSADGTQLTEVAPDRAPDARIEGATAAWVRALGPDADIAGLETSGKGELTSIVLDVLSLGQGREQAVEAESATS